MFLSEHFPLRPKTTMRIGGTAKYFGELLSKEDVEEVYAFSLDKHLPLIPLGGGSNTIFADGEIDALVVQVKNTNVRIDGTTVTVGAGKNLPMLINELAAHGLDLSPLTGILGTVGGAIFGNAGQGPKGIWIDAFVESVTVFDGEWKTRTKDECGFGYRESCFKRPSRPSPLPSRERGASFPSTRRGEGAVIWQVVLNIPKADPALIKANIQSLLQKRIETQPHLKTAGSCFKAVGDTPAWQIIDEVGLRGYKSGGIEVSPKHANFLMNVGEGTYANAVNVVETVKAKIPQDLHVEMRFIEPDGSVRFS